MSYERKLGECSQSLNEAINEVNGELSGREAENEREFKRNYVFGPICLCWPLFDDFLSGWQCVCCDCGKDVLHVYNYI